MATDGSEKTKLLDESDTTQPRRTRLAKWGSLALLILQNSSHVVLLRLSRIGYCAQYTTSVVVLFAELLKAACCAFTLLYLHGSSVREEFALVLRADTLKVAVPALCYTVQNNLQFVAASHLGPELLQLIYQTKTLATAIFGVIILSKTLRCNQWFALCVLVIGVVLAQCSQRKDLTWRSFASDSAVGVLAAFGVSVCSGFASVYFEKILKGDETSLWTRNLQLCAFSIPLQCAAIVQRDWTIVRERGVLHGFCPLTWVVVCMFAFGGLLVAVVIRFADNNLKNLAMALAILTSCLVSVPLFGFAPNLLFACGALGVLMSIFIFAWVPRA